jgi:hypothetical protein
MKNYILIIFLAIFLSACSDTNKNTIKYSIIKDVRTEADGNKIRSVTVSLSERTTADKLKLISDKVYSKSNNKNDSTLINFTIKGNSDLNFYWANTSYTPEIEINVNGFSNPEFIKIKNEKVKSNILASWMISSGIEHKMSIYKKDNNTVLKREFSNKPTSYEIYDAFNFQNTLILQNKKGAESNEYIVINKNGSLELWNESGNYYTEKTSLHFSKHIFAVVNYVEKYYVGSKRLNVRLAPNDTAEISYKLKAKDVVRVYETKGGWARISQYNHIDINETSNWVYGKYLLKGQIPFSQSEFKTHKNLIAEKIKEPKINSNISKQFSGWDGSHRNLEKFIKSTMNDPDSFQHEKTTYINNGDHLIVNTIFRGKNAFGALVLDKVTAKVSIKGKILSIIK